MKVELRKALDSLNEQKQIDTFIEVAGMHGPSTDEQEFGEYLTKVLEDIGFEVKFDDVQKNWNGTCGNMYAYWKGNDPNIPPLLLSAHLDTVFSTAGMKAIVEDGIIHSDGTTTIGSDDRAAIAAYIDGIRAVQETNMPCGPIELFFSVNEHTGLYGSKYMDKNSIISKGGFNFDHNGDVGQILIAGAHSYYFDIIFRAPEGRNGHIVMLPDGINTLLPAAKAMLQFKLGKLNQGLYVNLGKCNAGYMQPATPEETVLVGGVYGINQEDAMAQLRDMEQISKAAAEEYGVTCEFKYVCKYPGYRVEEDEPYLKCAVEAAEAVGIHWYQEETCGGGDTNNLRSYGIRQLTLGNGFRNPHNNNDQISVKNLVDAGKYTIALIHYWYEMNS